MVQDPSTNPSVIDAERHGRGITILGTDAAIVTVTGFTITGGDYTGLGNPDGLGGTVCRQGANVDCGGGLFVRKTALILHDCVVRDDIASRGDGYGGGIYLWETSYSPPVDIQNVQVISNAAGGPLLQGYGGDIYSYRIRGAWSSRTACSRTIALPPTAAACTYMIRTHPSRSLAVRWSATRPTSGRAELPSAWSQPASYCASTHAHPGEARALD